MKKSLLILMLLLAVGSSIAQGPTLGNLVVTGTDIKWYNAASGGDQYTNLLTPLVNGTIYYASQTVNGVESTSRLAVTATVVTQAPPMVGTHVPSQTQIVWNWNAASGASGYKWNTTNDYGSATNLGNVLTNTEALSCGTAYTRYIWAYNAEGCISGTIALNQSTASCITSPTVSTLAASNLGTASATLNGNITHTGNATVTTRGFKYSTTNNFDPSSSGTDVSESGSFGTGTFTASLSGLSTNTAYYVRAYASNTAGTTYGDQVSFKTTIQTEFSYTGGVQSFVVPAGVSSVTIEAWGAQGGIDSSPASGGLGGYSKGMLNVSPGSTLFVYVGGQGQSGGDVDRNNAGGWNGGGNGGYDNSDQTKNGGGGGGASDVRFGGQALGNRVIVAGGGGGSALGGAGGNGGGTIGANGGNYNLGGLGGTQSEGGTGAMTSRGATNGSLGLGGNGSTNQNAWGSAGGGGGYYGGAGGTSTTDHPNGWAFGGGGGSSYIGGVTAGSTTEGQRSGNGRILITY